MRLGAKNMDNKIFIFGAGASCENGIPLVKNILEEAMNDITVKLSENTYSFGTYDGKKADKYYTLVFKLIDDIYDTNLLQLYEKDVKRGQDIKISNVKNADKFRFEEFLSKIDESINSDKNIGTYSSETLKELQPYTHYIIFNTLSRAHSSADRAFKVYKKFIEDRLNNDNFYYLISLNYDILLDFELADFFFDNTPGDLYLPWNYAISFNHIDYKFERYNREGKDVRISLLKPHGSFNWVHCNNCFKITLHPYYIRYENCNYFEKKTKCPLCGSNNCELVLVPPAYFKKGSKFSILKYVRCKCAQALQRADEITIIGYSLPKEDVDIRKLLKTNVGMKRKPNIIVVNTSNEDMNKIEEFFKGQYDDFKKVEGQFSNYVEHEK